MQTHDYQKQVYSKTYIKKLYRKLRKQHRLSKAKSKRLKALLFKYCNEISLNQAKKIAASIALTLSLNVSTQAQQNFALPVENPFGLTTTGQYKTRSYGDIDGDGDVDMIESGDPILVYENIGSGSNPVFDNPMAEPWGLVGGGYQRQGQLVDIDGDQDLDFFLSVGGSLGFYENIGSSNNPNFAPRILNPFNVTDFHVRFAMADLDADGDFDMILLKNSSSGGIYQPTLVRFYENIGSATNPDFASPVNRTSVSGIDAPNVAICDMDADGDFDVLLGIFIYKQGCYNSDEQEIRYFVNQGSPTDFNLTQDPIGVLSNPLTLCEGQEIISSVDIDLDGDQDILSTGSYSGINYFYENLAIERSCTGNIFNSEDLELGFGIWNDGGRNCRISTRAIHANSGRKSIRLVARTTSSQTTTDDLDLSAYGTVSVDFSYIVRSYEGNESFLFQMSENGGPFTTLKTFTPGVDFENDQPKFVTINIDGPLSGQTKFRIKSRAYRRDFVFIDDITIHACLADQPAPRMVDQTPKIEVEKTGMDDVLIYPNPNNGSFTVELNASQNRETQIRIFDLQGKSQYEESKFLEQGNQKIEINAAHLQDGFYFLNVFDGKENKIKKFYKNSRN